MKISEILKELGKDGVFSTDKNRDRKYGHCYGKVYDYLFRLFDRDAKIDIIEVGVEHGASILAWRKFFPNANIIGVDIKDKVKEKLPNVEYVICNIKDYKPKKKFDIIIDDGSHRLQDVLRTVQNIKLKEGGIMILEDVQRKDYWLKHIRSVTKYTIEPIDLKRVHGQHDDFLIVLRNYGYYQ